MNTIIDSHGDNYIIQRTIARIYISTLVGLLQQFHLNIILYLIPLCYILFLFYSDRIQYEGRNNSKNFYSFILSLSIFLSFNRELSLRYYYIYYNLLSYFLYVFLPKPANIVLIKPFLILYCLSYLCYLLTRPWFIDQLSGISHPREAKWKKNYYIWTFDLFHIGHVRFTKRLKSYMVII